MKTLMAFDAAKARDAVKAGHAKDLLRELGKRYGVTFDGALLRQGPVGLLHAPADEVEVSYDEATGLFACDAQPELATFNNAGIPAWMTNYYDPAVIQALVAPMRATEIVGSEQKKGDWTTTWATFISLELTGQTSSYGDFNNNGMAGANVNFPQRQSYLYQTFTNWGERQLAMMGNARVDWANQCNAASILVLNKYQNATYFLGVSGLQNYGLLNDPSLPAPIVSAYAWNADATTAVQVYEQIRRMYVQAQLQTNNSGVIRMDSPCTLAMSPVLEVALQKTNDYNVNVKAMIQANFPNISIKTAPEYSTSAGELVQLIFNSVEGRQTAYTAFTEKMRAHAVVVGSSSWSQKKSQGTFGTIINLPYAIVSMLGA
jgi:hypothetical protein